MAEAVKLVLLHGFVQNRKIFDKQIAYFESKYEVHPLDLRGHGLNSNHEGPFGNEEYTDDVQKYFDEHRLHHVIFWATHTGTGVGINLYLRNSAYIDRMILEGVVIPGIDTPDIDRNIRRTKRVAAEKGLPEAYSDWVENSDWYQYMNSNPIRARKEEHYAIVKEFAGKPWFDCKPGKSVRDMRGELHNIKCKCLIYNGEYDMSEFIRMSRLFKDATHCEAEKIPASGGFPLWENYKYVNDLVEKWLNK